MATGVLDKHVECAVCFDTFRNPHALKCLHTYCHECITQLEKNGLIECPQCRDVSHIKEVKKDFRTQDLLDTIQSKKLPGIERELTELSLNTKGPVKCNVCQNTKKPVTCKCMQCNDYLCKSCETAHRGSKTSKSHKLVAIQNVLKVMQGEIRGILEELRKEVLEMIKKSNEVDQNIETIISSRDTQITDVNKYTDNLIKSIEVHRKAMNNTISDENENLVIDLKKSKYIISHHLASMKIRVDALQEIKSSSDINSLSQIINMFKLEFNEEREDRKSELADIDTDLVSPVKVIKDNVSEPQVGIHIEIHDEELTDETNTLADHLVSQHKGMTTFATSTPYSHLVKMRYKQDNSVDTLEAISHICIINNNIWACRNHDILIYNKSCEKVKQIKHGKIVSPEALLLTENGNIIVACSNNNGLHELDISSGQYKVRKIIPGSFAGLSICDNKIYILSCDRWRVVILEYQTHEWVETGGFDLDHHEMCCDSDRICVSNSGVYISSYENHCIYVYSLVGEFVQIIGEYGTNTPGKLIYPSVSKIDQYGNLMVVDKGNDRLQVYDLRGNWRVVSLNNMKAPTGVIAESGDAQYIWAATNSTVPKMIKYSKI